MTMFTKMLTAGAGLAALAAAAPAAAQYSYGYQNPYNPYAQQQYRYNPYAQQQQYRYNPYAQQQYRYNPYGQQQYGYGYQNPYAAQASQMAVQRCNAAVQSRLQNRSSMASILGILLGAQTPQGRVVSVTQVTPNRSTVRVRGLATSGRNAGYSPYGVSAYGAVGYGSQPDLAFRCDVDYRGYVRDIDFDRLR
jgi:hypothetical protein